MATPIPAVHSVDTSEPSNELLDKLLKIFEKKRPNNIINTKDTMPTMLKNRAHLAVSDKWDLVNGSMLKLKSDDEWFCSILCLVFGMLKCNMTALFVQVFVNYIIHMPLISPGKKNPLCRRLTS